MGRDEDWGELAVEHDTIERVWLPFTVARFGFTLLLVAGVPLGAALYTVPMDPMRGALAGGGFLAYLGVGYFVRPRPNHDNLGIAQGMIDHPFRLGDDWNRWLWSLQWLLFPGYLLARPVAEMFYWLAGEAEEG